MSRIAALKAKLRARENTPGYEKNCEAIRAEIARLETSPPPEDLTTSEDVAAGVPRVIYRDAGTGRIVSKDYADANPDTTIRQEYDL
jgi:hypothetical protein